MSIWIAKLNLYASIKWTSGSKFLRRTKFMTFFSVTIFRLIENQFFIKCYCVYICSLWIYKSSKNIVKYYPMSKFSAILSVIKYCCLFSEEEKVIVKCNKEIKNMINVLISIYKSDYFFWINSYEASAVILKMKVRKMQKIGSKN